MSVVTSMYGKISYIRTHSGRTLNGFTRVSAMPPAQHGWNCPTHSRANRFAGDNKKRLCVTAQPLGTCAYTKNRFML